MIYVTPINDETGSYVEISNVKLTNVAALTDEIIERHSFRVYTAKDTALDLMTEIVYQVLLKGNTPVIKDSLLKGM